MSSGHVHFAVDKRNLSCDGSPHSKWLSGPSPQYRRSLISPLINQTIQTRHKTWNNGSRLKPCSCLFFVNAETFLTANTNIWTHFFELPNSLQSDIFVKCHLTIFCPDESHLCEVEVERSRKSHLLSPKSNDGNVPRSFMSPRWPVKGSCCPPEQSEQQ